MLKREKKNGPDKAINQIKLLFSIYFEEITFTFAFMFNFLISQLQLINRKKYPAELHYICFWHSFNVWHPRNLSNVCNHCTKTSRNILKKNDIYFDKYFYSPQKKDLVLNFRNLQLNYPLKPPVLLQVGFF